MINANTEILLKNFKPYLSKLKEMTNTQKKFEDKLKKIKDEMQTLINDDKFGLEKTPQQQQEMQKKFQKLQQEGSMLERNYQVEIQQMNEKALSESYNSLKAIIKEWAENNNVEQVLDSNQVLFTDDKFIKTDEILEFLKEKELYEEFKEENFKSLTNQSQ